jgi:hypothetical protein
VIGLYEKKVKSRSKISLSRGFSYLNFGGCMSYDERKTFVFGITETSYNRIRELENHEDVLSLYMFLYSHARHYKDSPSVRTIGNHLNWNKERVEFTFKSLTEIELFNADDIEGKNILLHQFENGKNATVFSWKLCKNY